MPVARIASGTANVTINNAVPRSLTIGSDLDIAFGQDTGDNVATGSLTVDAETTIATRNLIVGYFRNGTGTLTLNGGSMAVGSPSVPGSMYVGYKSSSAGNKPPLGYINLNSGRFDAYLSYCMIGSFTHPTTDSSLIANGALSILGSDVQAEAANLYVGAIAAGSAKVAPVRGEVNATSATGTIVFKAGNMRVGYGYDFGGNQTIGKFLLGNAANPNPQSLTVTNSLIAGGWRYGSGQVFIYGGASLTLGSPAHPIGVLIGNHGTSAQGQPVVGAVRVFDGAGAFAGYITTLTLAQDDNDYGPVTGTFDVSPITLGSGGNAFQANTVSIAPGAGGANSQRLATLKLGEGTASIGTLGADATAATAKGDSELDIILLGTIVRITNSVSLGLYADADVTVAGDEAGFDLSDDATLTIASGGTLDITFEDPAPTFNGVYWGLRWEGDHTTELAALIGSGLTVHDNTTENLNPSNFYDSVAGYTYIGATVGAPPGQLGWGPPTVQSAEATEVTAKCLLSGTGGVVTVYWSPDVGTLGWTGANVLNGGAPVGTGVVSGVMSSLTADTFYDYAFYATNDAAGNKEAWSSTQTCATAITVAPNITGASGASGSSVQLEWDTTYDTETAFYGWYSNDTVSATGYLAAADALSGTLGGLETVTAYDLRVAASNTAGLGPWSSPTNATTFLGPKSLVSHWSFDSNAEATGGTAPHNASVYNGASRISAGGPVGNGGFYRLDGIDDYLSVPGTINDGDFKVSSTHPITISIWVKADLSGGNDNARYMMTGAVNDTHSGYSLNLSKSDAAHVARVGDGLQRIANGRAGLDVEQWRLMVGVFTLAPPMLTVQVYWDEGVTGGGAQSMITGSDPIANTQDLNMGRYAPTVPFKGDLDDPAVWSVALTQAEIAGLYNVGINATLGYTAREFDYLKTLHDAGPEGVGRIEFGGRTWYYRWKLPGDGGALVEDNGDFTLVLNPDEDTGVGTRPHPADGGTLLLFR